MRKDDGRRRLFGNVLFFTAAAARIAAVLGCIVLAACGERAAEDVVAARFPHQNVKFQRVERIGEAVCGEVNAPGPKGTSGYKRFVVTGPNVEIEAAAVHTPAEIAAFESTCSFAAGQPGASELCGRAQEARAGAERASRFEDARQRRCVAK